MPNQNQMLKLHTLRTNKKKPKRKLCRIKKNLMVMEGHVIHFNHRVTASHCSGNLQAAQLSRSSHFPCSFVPISSSTVTTLSSQLHRARYRHPLTSLFICLLHLFRTPLLLLHRSCTVSISFPPIQSAFFHFQLKLDRQN